MVVNSRLTFTQSYHEIAIRFFSVLCIILSIKIALVNRNSPTQLLFLFVIFVTKIRIRFNYHNSLEFAYACVKGVCSNL